MLIIDAHYIQAIINDPDAITIQKYYNIYPLSISDFDKIMIF